MSDATAIERFLEMMAAQAGAEQVRLDPRDAPKHAIERSADALIRRGTATVAALVAKPVRWAERFLLAPLVRVALPPLMARLISTIVPLAVAGALSVGALIGILGKHPVIGLLLAFAALVGVSIAAALGWVREENRIAAIATHARSAIVAGAR